tara:strand:- start:813 stop:2600 length:1788 start_codon:yes stop_codon:yes gene_type:complete
MNFVILEFSKTKHNLYNNLDYLGLNPYEQRHFCFHGGMGDPGGGEGSEAEGTGGGVDPGGEEEAGYDIGFSSAAQEASAAAAAAAAAAGDGQQDMGPMGWALDPFTQDLFAGIVDAYGNPRDFPVPTPRAPKERKLLPKMNTAGLGVDPVIEVLPKMDRLVDRETAADLGKNYLTMLTEAGLTAAETNDEDLKDQIQKELDRGALADYYQDYGLMNMLENVGFKSFGTGYRGKYEARTGKSVTRDQYDPNTITGAGTDERSATISLFNQFALANPNMTAMEAMAAFNATQSPDAQISAVDLGMLGYDPNAPAGPQAQANEDERYRGFVQGLGLIGKGVALGPVSVAADIALSGKTGEESVLGILGKELNDQTGIPDMIESAYDQFTTDLGKARDTVVDAVQENIVDPVSEFFSRGLDTPEQASISNFGRAEEAFFDPVDIGNPYAGLSTPEFEAQIAFEESQRGLQAEKEAAPGSDAANQLAEALENAAYYDSLMNPAAVSPPEPGSFFEGLDPKETQDYIDRVTTPEGVKLVRKTRAPAPRPPTVSEQVSAPRTGNFFPGSFDRPTATPRTRTQTIADIYGFSEEDADRMLGIA